MSTKRLLLATAILYEFAQMHYKWHMESKEWVWDNGIIREADVADMQKDIKTASKSELENVKLKVFENFLSKL